MIKNNSYNHFKKLNLYIENNFITDLDVLIIQNDYDVIWSHIFKSYKTQEISKLLIMKNIDQIQSDECWIMKFNNRKWWRIFIKARCFKLVNNDWRIYIWNNNNYIDSLSCEVWRNERFMKRSWFLSQQVTI